MLASRSSPSVTNSPARARLSKAVRKSWLQERSRNYEAQAGDRFIDLKRSPNAPVRLQGFTWSAGFERSAARPRLGSTDLPFLLVAIRADGLDFAADGAVASGACQCRLMILVLT